MNNCENCRHCEEWEGHKGFYCSNENAVKYLTDVDEKNETCEKWEANGIGYWKTYPDMKEDMYCSICDMDFPNNFQNRHTFRFCPFCGAKMEEVEE